MSLNLVHLNADVRSHMLSEYEYDSQNNGEVYLSKDFNEKGVKEYPALLKTAIVDHDAEWLAMEIEKLRLFPPQVADSRTKTGFRKVSTDAHTRLARSEFNRFYIRGLCLWAQEKEVPEIEVYRARASSRPRPESEKLIGGRWKPEVILDDLRNSIGAEPASGFPNPNSGLSAKIPGEHLHLLEH